MSVAATRFTHAEGRVSLAFSREGEKVVSVGSDGEMRIWAGIDDDDCESFLIGDEVLAVALNKTKIFAGIGGTNVLSGFNWEGESEGVVGPRMAADVTAVASCSTEENSLVVGCGDFSVKVINTDTFATVNLQGHTAPVLSVDMTSQGDVAASSSCDGTVRVWSCKAGEEVKLCIPDLHQKSNDVPNSVTVAGLRFSRDGSLLAVPRAGSGEVEVLGRDINWGRVGKVKLNNLQQKEIVTCLDWGNKASYIIAATSKGNLCLISYPALVHVKTIPSGRSQNICSIVHHPLRDEAVFADLGGHWGLVEKLEVGESTSSTVEEAKAEMEDMEALFNDDEDDENSFSVSKVTAQSGYVKDEDGNLTFGGERGEERPTSALSGVSGASEVPSDLVRVRAGVVSRPRTQPAFQPGASPEGLTNRFLVYNNVGIVKSHQSDAESSLDVEFHDVAVHHSLHLPNSENYNMAALSRQVLALARAGEEEGGKLLVNYFSSGDVNKEWSVEMRERERITGVAAGDSWVVVTTSSLHLRLFSAGGIQRQIVMMQADLVSVVGAGDRLMVVWDGGEQQLKFSLYKVDISSGLTPLNLSPLHLPISPHSELYWTGLSDLLTPATADTEGWVRTLDTRTGLWHPVLNTRDHTKGKTDFHYIVSLSHVENVVRTVLCRGSKYPPTIPRPIPVSLSMETPVLSLNTERGELEQSSLSLALQAKLLAFCPEKSEDSEETLEAVRGREVETLMKLFALACKSDHESRAVEVARLLPSADTVQLAIQYSVKMRRVGLAEKLGRLALELQERDQEIHQAEENVGTSGDDCEYPESQDMFETSQECENPLLKATRERELKPTPNLNIFSQSIEKKRNPFAKRPAIGESTAGPSQSGIVFDSLATAGLSGSGVKQKTGFGQRKVVLVTKEKTRSSASKQPLIQKEKENRTDNVQGAAGALKGFQLYFAENRTKFENEDEGLTQWKGLEKEEKESYKVARVPNIGGEAGKRKRGGSEEVDTEEKKVKLSATPGSAKQKLAGFAFSSN